MFTGIVEEVGSIGQFTPRPTGAELLIHATTVTQNSREGDSINVNGVCLTARNLSPTGFQADLSPETLQRTALSRLRAGAAVNLERALQPTSRMGGHIVQGHVDGVGKVIELRELGDGNWRLSIAIPDDVERYCVFKGSISIDGVSLTIAELESSKLSVAVIPHTHRHTAMRTYRPGDPVNLEIDVLAKYVEKMLLLRSAEQKPRLSEEKLREMGY